MKGFFGSFPLAAKIILKDPINVLLALVPTLIALSLYIFTISSIYRSSDRYVSMFRGYIYTADQATILGKILTAILIIFIFFLMSWTFVLIVGVLAAPFNSMLSSRIEKSLVQNLVEENKAETFGKIGMGLGATFINEFKKLIFLIFMAILAFLLNLFPLFYPVGLFIVATLLAIQFVDYSWSRHDMSFGACLKEVLRNIVPYSLSGLFFLLLVAIPVVNALIPAYATSYFTVLWLHRQKGIPLIPLSQIKNI